MSIMILVVLAVVWVAFLTPALVRRLSERRFTAGLRSYQRRLLRLGSSGLPAVAADRPVAAAADRPADGVGVLGLSLASSHVRDERYGTASPSTGGRTPAEPAGSPAVAPVAAPPTTASRATTVRRRQVVAVLGGSTLFFFLLGLIPEARIMWDFALLGLGCAATYAVLLVHFHRLAIERAQKVVALEARRHAAAVLESRRHVISVDRTRAAVAGYGGGLYAGAAPSYASAGGGMLSGSGWSVTGVLSRRPSPR